MHYLAGFVPTNGGFSLTKRGLQSFRTQCAPSQRPQRISHSAPGRTHAPPKALATRAGKSTALEDALLSTIRTLHDAAGDSGLHRYRKDHPSEFAAAAAAVSALEQSNAGFACAGARLRNLLPGTWTLVLTDAAAVEKNAGSVTGLGSLPGARCTRVDVELRRDGKARTVESIRVFGGLMAGENALIGTWRVAGKGGRTLEVTYASALLMGKTTVRADSKAVLETAYCSEKVRVGRSKGGEFYVFTRN